MVHAKELLATRDSDAVVAALLARLEPKRRAEPKDVGLDLATLVPEGITEGWRIDFEIGGTDATAPCSAGTNNCALACSPTVRITPADLGL